MNPAAALRTLTDLIESHGGRFIAISNNGHPRYRLGTETLTLPREHSFTGSRRAFKNVRAQILRVIRDQALTLIEIKKPLPKPETPLNLTVRPMIEQVTAPRGAIVDPRPFAPHPETTVAPPPLPPPAPSRPPIQEPIPEPVKEPVKEPVMTTPSPPRPTTMEMKMAALERAREVQRRTRKVCPHCDKSFKAAGLFQHINIVHKKLHPRWGSLAQHAQGVTNKEQQMKTPVMKEPVMKATPPKAPRKMAAGKPARVEVGIADRIIDISGQLGDLVDQVREMEQELAELRERDATMRKLLDRKA